MIVIIDQRDSVVIMMQNINGALIIEKVYQKARFEKPLIFNAGDTRYRICVGSETIFSAPVDQTVYFKE